MHVLRARGRFRRVCVCVWYREQSGTFSQPHSTGEIGASLKQNRLCRIASSKPNESDWMRDMDKHHRSGQHIQSYTDRQDRENINASHTINAETHSLQITLFKFKARARELASMRMLRWCRSFHEVQIQERLKNLQFEESRKIRVKLTRRS